MDFPIRRSWHLSGVSLTSLRSRYSTMLWEASSSGTSSQMAAQLALCWKPCPFSLLLTDLTLTLVLAHKALGSFASFPRLFSLLLLPRHRQQHPRPVPSDVSVTFAHICFWKALNLRHHGSISKVLEAKLITEQDFSPHVCHQQDNALVPLT